MVNPAMMMPGMSPWGWPPMPGSPVQAQAAPAAAPAAGATATPEMTPGKKAWIEIATNKGLNTPELRDGFDAWKRAHTDVHIKQYLNSLTKKEQKQLFKAMKSSMKSMKKKQDDDEDDDEDGDMDEDDDEEEEEEDDEEEEEEEEEDDDDQPTPMKKKMSQKQMLAKLFARQQGDLGKTAKGKVQKGKAMKANKGMLSEATRKMLGKTLKMKVAEMTPMAAADHCAKGSALTAKKMRDIAGMYSMSKNYQEATKDTDKKRFILALIKKLE